MKAQNIYIINFKQICSFKLSLDFTRTTPIPTTRESTIGNSRYNIE